MQQQLPENLQKAEEQLLLALNNASSSNISDRISINIKLEGLRILPVLLRLLRNIHKQNKPAILLWPDAGATALAKRDAPDLAQSIMSFSDLLRNKQINLEKSLIFAASPQPYDYEEFELICTQSNNQIIMINGKLDDSAVGIGSVARERRKNFISKWLNIYWLEPITKGALFHCYPEDWKLFRLDNDGYRFFKNFDKKPSSDEIFETFLE